MPDYERERLDQRKTENLLQQIEQGLMHSREIIGQIDMIRQLRFSPRDTNPLRPRAY